jgi:hypothetical protein
MTPAIGKTDCVDVSNTRWTNIALLCVVMGNLCSSRPTQAAPTPNFSAPAQAALADEILLLSTRSVGTVCESDAMQNGLWCQRYILVPNGNPKWISVDWKAAITSPNPACQTVIYIHGNRVARGEDRYRGMKVYRSLRDHGKPNKPIRFIIWSWPASTIPGPLKDYQVKANRTRPVSWQMAWVLNQMPAETPVSILGYSYGARIASGTMHLLGGGSLGKLKLAAKPKMPPFRIALLAAAFDADWLQPGHFHGRALGQVEHLAFTTNPHDPAMRFYHLSNGRGRVHALGKKGITNTQSIGRLAKRIQPINMSRSVGRSHYLTDYLAAAPKMRLIWQSLLPNENQPAKDSLAVNPLETRAE